MEENILKLLRFYTRIGRPLTPPEIYNKLKKDENTSIEETFLLLDNLKKAGKVQEKNGFYTTDKEPAPEKLVRRRIAQDVTGDKKWKKFLRLRRLFRFVPFIDFVFASGSMAIGNCKEHSDFDVIIGIKEGRIFTGRFFSVVVFGLAGKRRKKLSHKEEASDKICLNHFVTEPAYQLHPPYNIYWVQLYRNLVPLYGKEERLRRFFVLNEWASGVYERDLRFIKKRKGPGAVLEVLLGGALGDWVEKILGSYQRRRIARGLDSEEVGYKPRIVYNDKELEFHPDTARIEEMLV